MHQQAITMAIAGYHGWQGGSLTTLSTDSPLSPTATATSSAAIDLVTLVQQLFDGASGTKTNTMKVLQNKDVQRMYHGKKEKTDAALGNIHAQYMHRHAQYIHSTCTLPAHYLHTTCTLHAHYMHTTCSVCAVHAVCLQCTILTSFSVLFVLSLNHGSTQAPPPRNAHLCFTPNTTGPPFKPWPPTLPAASINSK